MKRFSGVLSLVMALCLISATVMAQDEPGARPGRGQRGGGGGGPGGGGPGGGGGFGRGMMGGMGGGGAMQLLGLLRMEEVRKEVNVSADAYEAVQKAQQEAFAGMGSLRDASDEERTKAMKDMNTKAQELLDEVVDPASMKRLMGLLLQQQGNTAVMNELISKEIGLKESDVKALGEAVAKSSEEGRAKMREAFQGGGPPDREKMTEMMAEMRKKSDAAIDEKLTADQKKAVEALKGEKFTFPEGGGFGFGGGRGAPGGGGPGGGRARPASDN